MSHAVGHTQADIEKYGWTSVPHDQTVLLRDVSPWDPANYTIPELQFPDSGIAKSVTAYAKEQLPEQVFNHSMRVYYYGQCLAAYINRMEGAAFRISGRNQSADRKHRSCDCSKAPALLLAQPGDLLSDLPTPRYRHHAGQSSCNFTLIRVLWRISRAEFVARVRCYERAGRKRHRSNNSTSRIGFCRQYHNCRPADSARNPLW